jgi:hypothetical protein
MPLPSASERNIIQQGLRDEQASGLGYSLRYGLKYGMGHDGTPRKNRYRDRGSRDVSRKGIEKPWKIRTTSTPDFLLQGMIFRSKQLCRTGSLFWDYTITPRGKAVDSGGRQASARAEIGLANEQESVHV